MLFKTTDEGMNWKIISPDLTRNDKASRSPLADQSQRTIPALKSMTRFFPSWNRPVQKDLIWAGSDDGLIHVTTDGGKNWDNVTPKAMPEWGTVSMIEASIYNAGTAYVAVQRHKMDDFTPYIFKTTDFGKTWTSITSGIPADEYVHAVREDQEAQRAALCRHRTRRFLLIG